VAAAAILGFRDSDFGFGCGSAMLRKLRAKFMLGGHMGHMISLEPRWSFGENRFVNPLHAFASGEFPRRTPSIAVLLAGWLAASLAHSATDNPDRIQPYLQNPYYWQYEGRPILLRGGSDEDNPFQWTGRRLTDHLDLLVSVGGNYIRNTMSDRDEGNVYAFQRDEEDRYDLRKWNGEYWDRLRFFLEETQSRGIIVQLTLWDQHDHSGGLWRSHPWNPDNNVNYGSEEARTRNEFYDAVKQNRPEILQHQNRFIEKLASITLEYNHVLYNINNEGWAGVEWENYWAAFMHRQASERGKQIHVTSMSMRPFITVRQVLTYPELYSFVEISQNNQDSMGGRGHAHWENIMNWRAKLASRPMPMNNEKIYGAGDGSNYSAGEGKEAVRRFWRNIFAGCASSRFHRPTDRGWGIGLGELAQTQLKAMNLLLKELDVFSCSPHNDLLTPLDISSEAYCLADIGKQYAIYFPDGRHAIELDPWVFADAMTLRWLDIERGQWSDETVFPIEQEYFDPSWLHKARVRLQTPDNRPHVALLTIVN
jgi:hypothetical protein